MIKRITVVSLVGIAFWAMPQRGAAEYSGDVSPNSIDSVLAPYLQKSKQSLKPNERLKGTVRYQMEHGRGKGDDTGRSGSDNIQSPDPPENWVEVGQNSRGVIRWGPSVSQTKTNDPNTPLATIKGHELPPCDWGQNYVWPVREEIYGSEGVPPPYEFNNYTIDSPISGLTSDHPPRKSEELFPENKTVDLNQTTVKPIAPTPASTNGGAGTGSAWIDSNASEPGK